MLQPLEKALILPEVADSKAWWRGHHNWFDPDTKTYLNYREYPTPPILINTDLVRPEELKSWNNLLDPKWKGKILLDDPTASSGGQSLMSILGYGIMGWDWVDRFIKQDPVLLRDSRLLVEWVARGKHPMELGGRTDMGTEFIRKGAPVAFHIRAEGTYMGVGSGFIALLKTSPHPNAAKVFLNYFLSKEGQTTYSQISGFQSARDDVPTGHLLTVRQPGAKYFSLLLERDYLDQLLELRRRVASLFQPLVK